MIEFLLEHADKNPVSFHMPGHKGSAIFKKYGFDHFLERFVDCDITEIPGADNLFQAEGIIQELQDRYARLYDVKYSYLMINGTSGGLIAGILASVPFGGKLIMARNCHKSVFNALTLGNISPVYAYPCVMSSYGISGAIPPEEIALLLKENPDASAVILPSPNYYGICSDIEAIAKIVHKAGKVLIVDQAHGAHLHFFHKYGFGGRFPKSAEMRGADIVVNSVHKTLASFTQSAVLNLNSDRVERYVLEDKIQAIESTSPSYILMASLDLNARILESYGGQAMGEWQHALEYFYNRAGEIDGLKVLNDSNHMDHSKINLDMSAYGIDGARLERLLMEHGIFSELYSGDLLMLMTGIGNTRENMIRTLDAMRDIASKHALGKSAAQTAGTEKPPERTALYPIPRKKEFVKLKDAEGKICASSIIPYPPGIPISCPGEIITAEVIEKCRRLREIGEKVIGINDRGQVIVGTECPWRD